MNYKLDFGPVLDGLPNLLWGCLGTLGLALCGMLLAIVIGIGGVVLRDSRIKPLRWLVIGFRRAHPQHAVPGADLLHLLRPAPAPASGSIRPSTAIIALGINGGAYAIEIIRGGVQSIPKGQMEAGLALGLHKAQVFRLIMLKPALRAIYPSLTSQFVLLTLTTSIASAISAYELTSVAQRIESDTFRSFEVYFTVTIFYLVISWLMMRIFALLSAALLQLSGQVRSNSWATTNSFSCSRA